jgi:hypothetical protein
MKLSLIMNREYLLIAAACAALAIAVVAEDVAAAIIVIFGSVIYWKNHKIEVKLNRLLARRRRRESTEASDIS